MRYGNAQILTEKRYHPLFVENEIPDDVDSSDASLIEFTKNGGIGCYGILLDQLILLIIARSR